MTASSLLCIENAVFSFRWRDDRREKESRVVGVDGGGLGCGRGGSKKTVLFKLQNLGLHLFTIQSERQTVRRKKMRDQEEEGSQRKRRR